jgi:hypothetical protein
MRNVLGCLSELEAMCQRLEEKQQIAEAIASAMHIFDLTNSTHGQRGGGDQSR